MLAEDAFAARQLLYETQPDVLIVDAHLPYVSGVELVERVLADRERHWRTAA